MKSNKIRKILAFLGFYSKPTFLILGAQKAGTTSLFSILNQHSLIKSSLKKEVHYFDDDNWYNKSKISDYHLFFPLKYKTKRNTQIFEASPSYLIHPKVAERLFKYNQNLSLLFY
jgi:hypothetical protein